MLALRAVQTTHVQIKKLICVAAALFLMRDEATRMLFMRACELGGILLLTFLLL